MNSEHLGFPFLSLIKEQCKFSRTEIPGLPRKICAQTSYMIFDPAMNVNHLGGLFLCLFDTKLLIGLCGLGSRGGGGRGRLGRLGRRREKALPGRKGLKSVIDVIRA